MKVFVFVIMLGGPVEPVQVAPVPAVSHVKQNPKLERTLHRKEQKPLSDLHKRMLKQGYRYGRDLKHEGIDRWDDGLFWPKDAGPEPDPVYVGGF